MLQHQFVTIGKFFCSFAALFEIVIIFRCCSPSLTYLLRGKWSFQRNSAPAPNLTSFSVWLTVQSRLSCHSSLEYRTRSEPRLHLSLHLREELATTFLSLPLQLTLSDCILLSFSRKIIPMLSFRRVSVLLHRCLLDCVNNFLRFLSAQQLHSA